MLQWHLSDARQQVGDRSLGHCTASGVSGAPNMRRDRAVW